MLYRRSASYRFIPVTAASAIALMSAMPTAVSGAEAQSAQTSFEEIIVTGSRIVRDGYEAPTPVTVVGVETLQDAAKTNIADVLNTLPAFQGSTRLANGSTSLSGANAGTSSLNLRGMGPERTLVLFDGRRMPPAFINGVVDTGQLPDALVSRVDVVTGGASAAYGSDAVAGVVNYILDTEFQGVKGQAVGGITGRGDREEYKVQLAAGFKFANDRGHILLSGDFSRSAQLRGYEREWNTVGYVRIPNPSFNTGAGSGNPQLIQNFNTGMTDMYGGGIIVSGPLKGTAFGAGGEPFVFDYGSLVSMPTYHVGGNWRDSNMQAIASLSPVNPTKHMFNRVSYDVTDNVTLFGEFIFGQAYTFSFCCYQYYHGNLTVRPDNPFMPTAISQRMTALGLTQAAFGKTVRDLPAFGAGFDRMSHIYTAGGKGRVDAFDRGWNWNFYFQRGISKISGAAPQSNIDRFAAAIDAVRAPNGQIVCRVNNDANTANDMPGCVPYNLFGLPAEDRPLATPAVNSQAALDYITGGIQPYLGQRLSRDTISFDIGGEPFSTWAGPVSLALGAEWRKDKVVSVNDALSTTRRHYSTNFATPFSASGTVTEGFVETVVPLARQESWAQNLDLNAAARFTSYSASGFVSTWKAGLTYNPVNEIRLRVTQSRDIRAPNLTELFSTPSTGRSTSRDPFRNNGSFPRFTVTVGNSTLVPEKADTTGLGVVFQPEWLPGFNASVDYFRINVKGVIGSVDAQSILDRCFGGETRLCQFITRLPVTPAQAAQGITVGDLESILQQPINQSQRLVKGLDLEASYRTRLDEVADWMSGDLALRVVASNAITNAVDNNVLVIDTAGANGDSVPSWSMTFNANYSLDRFRVSWTGRYISSGTVSNEYIECTTGCPNPIPAGKTTIDNNRVSSYFTSDVSLTYRFYQGDGPQNAEAFVTIDNLFDRDPPLISQSGNAYGPHTNANLYDVLGRSFRAGVRFRM